MTLEERPLPDWLNVSRETHHRLQEFYALVCKWNRAINLVSAASLEDGWRRHILDSAQLLPISGCTAGPWLDIGSGAGLPGLVVAIMADETLPKVHVTLVESDRRKSTFLSQAIRQLGLKASVFPGRLESLPEMDASVVSARAFAPLDKILGLAARHMSENGAGLFMKGQTYQAELNAAQQNWRYECDVIPSKTDANAVILKVQKVRHVQL
jgi:16S rRNA (guanine527-N7)-methyltransferase